MSRFVVEVEADVPSPEFLQGYLEAMTRIVAVRSVEAGSIQDVCDEVHSLRDRLEL